MRAAQRQREAEEQKKKEQEEQARNAPPKLDTLIVRVMDADGREPVPAPVDVDVLLADRWAARVRQGAHEALVVRSAGEIAGRRVRVELPNRQYLCGDSIPAKKTPLPAASGGGAAAAGPTAATGDPRSSLTGQTTSTPAAPAASPPDPDTLPDPALTLLLGVERSSASNFSADRTSPALGVRWDLGGRKRFLRMAHSVVVQSDYTQVANVREFRSCQAERRATRRVPQPGEVLAYCLAPDTSGPEYVYHHERADSVRASLSGTWRTFLAARSEADPGLGFRLGPVGMIGFQTDPRGISTTGYGSVHRPLRVMRSVGIGFRNVDPKTNIERLRLDVMYGSVQNYVSVDRPLRPSAGDTIRAYAPLPVGFGGRDQWQALLSMRLWKGAYIRGFGTLNAPGPRAPTARAMATNLPQLRDPGAPDLVRVAFLMTRDVKSIWDTLTGAKGAKDPGATPPSAPAQGGGAGTAGGTGAGGGSGGGTSR